MGTQTLVGEVSKKITAMQCKDYWAIGAEDNL